MKVVQVKVPESLSERDVKVAAAIEAFSRGSASVGRAAEIAELLSKSSSSNSEEGASPPIHTQTTRLSRSLSCEQSCPKLLRHNALSTLGHLDRLKHIFEQVLIARAVHEEICVRGRGLIGERELREAVRDGLIIVKDVKNRMLVNALLDPLAIGEAETLALTVDERADYIALDDKLARRRAKSMGLNVIGTLRVLKLMYDAKLIDKHQLLESLEKPKEIGFRISDELINKTLRRI